MQTTKDLINVPVTNLRNNQTGVAEQLNDGTWSVIYDDTNEQKIVAASTFKRWFKVEDEEAKKVIDQEIEALTDTSIESQVKEEVEDKVEAPEQDEVEDDKKPQKPDPTPNKFEGQFILVNRKAVPSRTPDQWNTLTVLAHLPTGTRIEIKDHKSFIVDVRVFIGGELQFKSPKCSIVDLLTNYYQLEGDDLNSAKSHITQLRKNTFVPVLSN